MFTTSTFRRHLKQSRQHRSNWIEKTDGIEDFFQPEIFGHMSFRVVDLRVDNLVKFVSSALLLRLEPSQVTGGLRENYRSVDASRCAEQILRRR
jgi:hypothetical protein